MPGLVAKQLNVKETPSSQAHVQLREAKIKNWLFTIEAAVGT